MRQLLRWSALRQGQYGQAAQVMGNRQQPSVGLVRAQPYVTATLEASTALPIGKYPLDVGANWHEPLVAAPLLPGQGPIAMSLIQDAILNTSQLEHRAPVSLIVGFVCVDRLLIETDHLLGQSAIVYLAWADTGAAYELRAVVHRHMKLVTMAHLLALLHSKSGLAIAPGSTRERGGLTRRLHDRCIDQRAAFDYQVACLQLP